MRCVRRFLKLVPACTGVEQEIHRAHRSEARGTLVLAGPKPKSALRHRLKQSVWGHPQWYAACTPACIQDGVQDGGGRLCKPKVVFITPAERRP